MSLGEKLQQAREDAGFSIKDLADITKIQEKYLERLEAEEYDKLPTPVYIRGFIQKWALVCSADSDKLLMQFYRENKPFINKSEGSLSNVTAPRLVITGRHLVYAIIIVSLLSLAGYFTYHQRIFSTTPYVQVLSPTEFNSVSDTNHVLIKGRVDNVQKILINEQEITLQDNGDFKYDYQLSPGLNTVIIKAQSSNGREVETIRKILRL